MSVGRRKMRDRYRQKFISLIGDEFHTLESSCDTTVRPLSEIVAKYVNWREVCGGPNTSIPTSLFAANVSTILASGSGSLLSKDFFQKRYGLVENWEGLFERYTALFITGRPNPYSVEDVAVKNACSTEEAEKIIQHHKHRTRGTKETFVRKYGAEEGIKRFRNKQQVCKSTEDNFKARYGEEGETRWLQYLASRDTRSLESYVVRHGEQQGREKYERTVRGWTRQMSRDGFIERYGSVDGTNRYEEMTMKKSGVYRFYAARDPDTAVERYRDAIANSGSLYWKSPEWEIIAKRLTAQRRKVCLSSSQAKVFFADLERCLGRDLRYGGRKDEIMLFDPAGFKYYYDCYDERSNTIIEFNGSAWHYREGNTCSAWKNVSDDIKKISLLRDDLKRMIAESRGYQYIVVWDKDTTGKLNRANTLNELVKQLNNKETI
jgi:hypothetical protein